MNIKECLEAGLLKKEFSNLDKVSSSFRIADYKLEKAKKLLELQMFEDSILNAYSAMFHAARAMLFRDGIREKSHYALYIYIKEKYGNKLERRFLTELNTLRIERHEISYGLEKKEFSKKEAKDVLDVVEEFVACIKRIK